MKLTTLLLVLLFSISCSSNKEIKKSDNKNINQIFETYWDERAKFFPLDATQQGDNRFNHMITNDQTEEYRRDLKSFYKAYLKQLTGFKRERLSEKDKLSYDTFKFDLEIQLEGLKLETWKIPFQQFWGLPLLMGQLGSGESYQPFQTIKDYENWLGRLKDFQIWSDAAIENFREGMKTGVVLPAVLVKKMIPQMKALVVREPRKSLFYNPILNMPNHITLKDKKKISEEYIEAITKHVNPTYKKLATFLKREYLPKARTTHGISSIPKGQKIYNYLVKYWTTTSMTPKQIHKVGLREVKRIRLEMERIKDQVNYSGSLKSFFSFMKKDKYFTPYNNPSEILTAFHNIHKKMSPQLKNMFNKVPKTPFEIRQTEEFRAASASAEYSQGAPDGSRPGIFYIPIIDAKKFNVTSGMESLFLHEAIPGHHYQISLQQENESLPKFRRFSWYGAYGEGWALYTESLGRELGLYTDPYQYMGALSDEMHRAVRLVVDVGIHTQGMTREKGIKYMLENEPISEEGAVAEVERYMAIPGQALSYKIGSLKIWQLRNRFHKKLGPKFDLANFHDEFLKDGCLPLEVAERKMEAWAKSFKN